MPAIMRLVYDRVGSWSIIKLEIIKKYAKAYSQILASRKNPELDHIYIDAFAGSGKHISKDTDELIPGSPQIVLDTKPPFKEYHFIDLDGAKVNELLKLTSNVPNTYVYWGDCNVELLDKVFPRVKYSEYKRGLCLLDPYGMHLKWEVVETAGRMKSIDMFLNFPIADMNRNVFWHNPSGVTQDNIQRMNNYWGNDSWRDKVYTTQKDLLGTEVMIKQCNSVIVSHFIERLHNIAGFKYISKPLRMRNSNNATVYYLFFASQHPEANYIISDIFARYR